jgi:hypothetical protein
MADILIVIAIVAGFAFYALRCRQRLCYGVLELMVSLVIFYLTFHPPYINLVVDKPTFSSWLLSQGVGLLAGVYVMVRGLANIEKGLPPQLRVSWDRVFYRKA